MIFDKNIDPKAGISPSKVLGSGLIGAAKIFYAGKNGSNWAAYYRSRAPKTQFFDSSTAVQSAVYATLDGRGDVVIVGPGKHTESVIVGSETAGSNKSGLKIIGAGHGWEQRMRPSDATTKNATHTPTGGSAQQGCAFVIVSRGVELTGFLLDGGGNYAGVYVGDGYNALGTSWNENSASAWIHHNTFRGGNEGTYGLLMDGCSADVEVSDNKFVQTTVAGIYITPGGTRTVQRPLIHRNFFNDCAGYGIDMYSHGTTVGMMIDRNVFADGVSTTMTAGVQTLGAGVHSITNNRFACATPMLVVATDFVSGNTYGFAGSTAAATNKYITEANAGAEA